MADASSTNPVGIGMARIGNDLARLEDDRPIGVFDSGLGGLTVARSIATALPHESIYYVGDTKRCPYGTRHPQPRCERRGVRLPGAELRRDR